MFRVPQAAVDPSLVSLEGQEASPPTHVMLTNIINNVIIRQHPNLGRLESSRLKLDPQSSAPRQGFQELMGVIQQLHRMTASPCGAEAARLELAP
jgi:hypothetical protein